VVRPRARAWKSLIAFIKILRLLPKNPVLQHYLGTRTILKNFLDDQPGLPRGYLYCIVTRTPGDRHPIKREKKTKTTSWTSTVFLFDATFHSISLRKVLLLQKADTGNKNNTRTRHFIQDHALFWSSIAEEKLEINWKEKVSNWRLQSLRVREIIN